MPRALVLGGTGSIGLATARRLLASGWDVDLTGRDPNRMPAGLTAAGARFLASDRGDGGQLRAAFGDGVDLLVDCVCFTAADATRLLPLAREAGSTVLISSKAVYVDADGNHSNSDVAPRYDGPILETQPTLPPGGGDYTTREGYGVNKVAAEQVLLDSGALVTVLRPSKVHGAGAARPREWVFVKRVLDRRPAVFLARRGEGTDHTTAAANVAALIETVAAKPGRRILNAADPDAPSALEIARTIGRHLGHDWDEVLLDADADEEDGLGATPWDALHPVVLDVTAATELGWAPAGDYETTVAEEVDWLVSDPTGRPADDDEFFAPVPRLRRRGPLPPRLERRVEQLGVLVLGRRPVHVDEQVDVTVVRRLQRRPGLDVDQAAGRRVLPLGRLAEIHRQRPREDDEGLLLGDVAVAVSLRARLVAPEVRPRVREAGQLTQLGDVPGRLARLVRTRDPLELVGTDRAEGHARTLARGGRQIALKK